MCYNNAKNFRREIIIFNMLFYPRNEVRIFGHRLPFTPGAIPKGKERLAKAAGQVVAGTLMTKEDIESRLLSEEIENEIADLVMRQLQNRVQDELCLLCNMSEENYAEKKAQLGETLSQEIVESIHIQEIVQEKGASFLREHAQNRMLSMFLTERRCQEIATSIGVHLQKVVDEHGTDYVKPVVMEKFDNVSDNSTLNLLEQFDITEEKIRSAVISAYRKIVTEKVEEVLARLDIASVVTEKINAMSVEEVEKLVFIMMKKELNTIVSLGALIGFVLGLLNIFI